MTRASEIGRHIYEEARQRCVNEKSVRLELRIDHYQRRWPEASQDDILRAQLIAYELLIADVAEAVSAAKTPRGLPLLGKSRGGNAAPDDSETD